MMPILLTTTKAAAQVFIRVYTQIDLICGAIWVMC